MDKRPTLIRMLPSDLLDRRLATARCAAPALPSDLATIAAIVTRATAPRARAAATYRWCAAHPAHRAARKN